MIFTEFAPNETIGDAFLALKMLVQPWRWRRGKEILNLKRRLKSRFFSDDTQISLFLTGRAALYQYLGVLGLKKNDEVLLQAFTCEAVVLPIIKHGLTPVYVDISEKDFSFDFDDLQKKITAKTKVLILQHTFGITPKARENIILIVKKYKLHLIEDVAHGFDPALFQGKKIPGAVLISFGRSKPFSSVFGGAIALRTVKTFQALKESERQMANPSLFLILHIIFYKINAVVIKLTYDIFVGKLIHFLFKQFNLLLPEISKKEKSGQFDNTFLRTFPNICAVFMLKQLDTFNDVYQRRKRVSALYNKNFATLTYDNPALMRYPLLVQDREAILKLGKKRKVQFGSWYRQVVAPPELDLAAVGYRAGSCPNAEKITNRIINLPTNISTYQAKNIIELLKKI